MRLVALLLSSLFLSPVFAHADTISSFDVEFVRNATNGPSSDLGTLTSSLPLATTFGGYNCTANLSLSGSSITIDLTNSCSVLPQDFGGLVFTDLTPDTTIGSATLDASSTLSGPVVTYTSSQIFLNLEADGWASGQSLVVDFGPPAEISTTPEPGSLALLATGMFGLGGVVRRRMLSRA